MNIEEYRNRIEKAHTFTGIPSYWDELQEVIAERDRLRRLVAELLPFMIEDVRQGVSLGELPFDTDHCDSEDSPCPDCEWHKDSAVWLERINAGEFSEYGQTKHAE